MLRTTGLETLDEPRHVVDRRARWNTFGEDERQRLLREHAPKLPAGKVPDDGLLYVIFFALDNADD
jgi:hypothetical protein